VAAGVEAVVENVVVVAAVISVAVMCDTRIQVAVVVVSLVYMFLKVACTIWLAHLSRF
jgi:hypothetical protein